MNILFVCSGNACRSPIAEGFLKKAAADRGVQGITAASRGIEVLPKFKVPLYVVSLMADRGVDLSAHKPKQIDKKTVAEADLILVMEVRHLQQLMVAYPKAADRISLLKSYVGVPGNPEIPDPIGKSIEVYEATARDIEEYVTQLVERLANTLEEIQR